MDPITLAAAVGAVLAPYLKDVLSGTAEGVGEHLGDALTGSLRRLLHTIKRWVAGDGYAAGVVERFEQEPDNELRRATFQDMLAEVAGKDPAFATELEKVMAEVTRAGGSAVAQQVTDAGAIAGRDFTQNAQYAAGRDQHFGMPTA